MLDDGLLFVEYFGCYDWVISFVVLYIYVVSCEGLVLVVVLLCL